MNIGELQREFLAHATTAGLTVECAMDGDINAELVIISERPGPREAEMKLPLVGGSGRVLWEACNKFGIRRTNCYITNVIKRQVLEVKGKLEGISKNEMGHWQHLLRWELSRLPNAKYILILGGAALETVVGVTGVDAWRGSVLQEIEVANVVGRTFSVAISYNPANIIRKPSLEPIFMQDIAKMDIVMRGQWKEHPIRAYYDPSPKEAIEWCNKMIQEDAVVSYDIETVGGETACVGFANQAHEGMCINFRTRSENRFSVADEVRIRRSVQRVLAHAKVRLVAQNGGFDSAWLWYKDRIKAKPLYLDTLLAHHTLHPTWPHGLGFLTAQYTTHPYYKDEIHEWREGADISTFWEYNVKDCCITWEVARKLEATLRHQKLWPLYEGHVAKLQPKLIEATVLGNLVDMPMKAKLEHDYEALVTRLEADFQDKMRIATGIPDANVNPNSPKQLAKLFFQDLKLIGKTTSTDEANKDVMIASPRTTEPARAMLIAHTKFKESHKLLSTYIKSQVDPDMRMRSDYKQYGTQFVPGRLSSSSTLWGSGMNLQNQPEMLRGMFIADPGYVYVYFDGAQAEARIVAYEANITTWKHQFEMARLNPGTYDAHIALAAEMFKVPLTSISRDDYFNAETDDNGETIHTGHNIGDLTMRGKSKRCRHGLNYRMQADRLATVLGCSLREAERLWQLYHATTPELRRWWDDIIREVRETRTLYTCLGRRMEFLGSRLDESLMDSIIAFKPQSTLGDFVCGVQWKAQDDDLWPRDARIPFNNHDSLTALCREKDVGRVASILRKYAEAPLIIKGEPLIIPCDFKVTYPDENGVHRWSNMKKLKV